MNYRLMIPMENTFGTGGILPRDTVLYDLTSGVITTVLFRDSNYKAVSGEPVPLDTSIANALAASTRILASVDFTGTGSPTIVSNADTDVYMMVNYLSSTSMQCRFFTGPNFGTLLGSLDMFVVPNTTFEPSENDSIFVDVIDNKPVAADKSKLYLTIGPDIVPGGSGGVGPGTDMIEDPVYESVWDLNNAIIGGTGETSYENELSRLYGSGGANYGESNLHDFYSWNETYHIDFHLDATINAYSGAQPGEEHATIFALSNIAKEDITLDASDYSTPQAPTGHIIGLYFEHISIFYPGMQHLKVLDLNTGNELPLTFKTKGGFTSPGLGPDTKRIVFYNNGGLLAFKLFIGQILYGEYLGDAAIPFFRSGTAIHHFRTQANGSSSLDNYKLSVPVNEEINGSIVYNMEFPNRPVHMPLVDDAVLDWDNAVLHGTGTMTVDSLTNTVTIDQSSIEANSGGTVKIPIIRSYLPPFTNESYTEFLSFKRESTGGWSPVNSNDTRFYIGMYPAATGGDYPYYAATDANYPNMVNLAGYPVGTGSIFKFTNDPANGYIVGYNGFNSWNNQPEYRWDPSGVFDGTADLQLMSPRGGYNSQWIINGIPQFEGSSSSGSTWSDTLVIHYGRNNGAGKEIISDIKLRQFQPTHYVSDPVPAPGLSYSNESQWRFNNLNPIDMDGYIYRQSGELEEHLSTNPANNPPKPTGLSIAWPYSTSSQATALEFKFYREAQGSSGSVDDVHHDVIYFSGTPEFDSTNQYKPIGPTAMLYVRYRNSTTYPEVYDLINEAPVTFTPYDLWAPLNDHDLIKTELINSNGNCKIRVYQGVTLIGETGEISGCPFESSGYVSKHIHSESQRYHQAYYTDVALSDPGDSPLDMNAAIIEPVAPGVILDQQNGNITLDTDYQAATVDLATQAITQYGYGASVDLYWVEFELDASEAGSNALELHFINDTPDNAVWYSELTVPKYPSFGTSRLAVCLSLQTKGRVWVWDTFSNTIIADQTGILTSDAFTGQSTVRIVAKKHPVSGDMFFEIHEDSVLKWISGGITGREFYRAGSLVYRYHSNNDTVKLLNFRGLEGRGGVPENPPAQTTVSTFELSQSSRSGELHSMLSFDALDSMLATGTLGDIFAVDTIQDRDALSLGYHALVLASDATGDPDVSAGSAMYMWNSVDMTWTMLFNTDVVISPDWSAIADKPLADVMSIDTAISLEHEHTNYSEIAAISQASSGNMAYNGIEVHPGFILHSLEW